MPAPTLTTRRLNRALLARQHLLVRTRRSIPGTLESIGGIQMQYAPSGYIGLWSRMELGTRDRLTRSLQRRHVVQGTLLRGTIHLVPAASFPWMSAGIRTARQKWWMRIARGRGLDHLDHEHAAQVVRSALADGPRRQRDLVEALESSGYPRALWEGVRLWVDLVRIPPSGTWERRRADLFGLADQWIDMPPISEDEGLAYLAATYLRAFGPAAVEDMAGWAGVPNPSMASAVERLTLRRFSHEDGADLVDLPRAPLPAESTAAPVRFLPTWDATLLVHARRTGILPEGHRPLIFSTKTPHSVGIFLVDGAVAGTWRFDAGRVITVAFEKLLSRHAAEVADEAARLAAFHLE